MVSHAPAAGKTAQELLADFVRTGNQQAYEEVVRRYAGMVFNVCYGVLKDSHDAEDATQAVFLTLAVQSKTEAGVKYLAPWLQKVAQRLSLDIRRSKTRRKAREERHSFIANANAPKNDHTHDVGMGELKVILRDELDKLPAKYRMPLILHYFGGLKPEDLARELGLKPSTLGVRLHRGRKMLADNLNHRGFNVSGAVLSAALAVAVQSSVSEHLVHNTCQAATHFASGNLASSGVTAQVIGYNKLATTGLLVAKIKSAVATGLLIAAAAAGAAEVVRQIAPLSLNLRAPFDLRNWIEQLIDRAPPIRLSDASLPLPVEPDLAPIDLPATESFTLCAARMIESPGDGASARKPVQATAPIAVSSWEAAPFSATPARATRLSPLPIAPAVAAPLAATSVFVAPQAAIQQGAANVHPALLPALRGQDVFAGDLVLDSTPGSSARFVYSSPASLNAVNLTIGDRGAYSFVQESGQVRVASMMTLGRQSTGSGEYVLRGDSTLSTARLVVADAGRGQFDQYAPSVNIAPVIEIARTGTGTYNLHGGEIHGRQLTVAVAGKGSFNQSGGSFRFDLPADSTTHLTRSMAGPGTSGAQSDPTPLAFATIPTTLRAADVSSGQLNIAVKPGSQGSYTLDNGTLAAGNQVIGFDGKGTFRQTNGTNTAATLKVGAARDGTGIYQLQNGSLEIMRRADSAGIAQVVIGDGSRGTLQLGLGTMTGASPTICETSSGAPVSMVVRAQPTSDGSVRGWGKVSLRGVLDQNGQVIADGQGVDRDLDLSSFSRITNQLDNSPFGERNGWFATNGGRLVLPAQYVRSGNSTVTFGESQGDPSLDLVNSVRLTLEEVSKPGFAKVSIVSADRADVPDAPEGVSFAAIWQTDLSDIVAESVQLTARYDDANEAAAVMQLWAFDGRWVQVGNGSVTRDPSRHMISGVLSPAQFVAVGASGHFAPMSIPSTPGAAVPEPGAIGLFALAGLMLKRRRR